MLESRRSRMLAGAVAAIAIGGGIGAARYRGGDTPITRGNPSMEGSDAGIVNWCAQGLEPIAAGGCFSAAPPNAPQPPPLVVYLHGRFERTAPEGELDRQKRFADRARAKGFALLALRGREGQCLQPELASWVCWPASERSVDAGAGYVATWQPALDEATARTGNGKRYVLGFSSGGFFAVILATRALVPADAFVIAGAGPIEPTHAEGATPPLLLLSGDDDPSQPGMIQLDQELTREKWPHDQAARAGGHELTDADIDMALTFFTRSAKEKVPLHPPLSTHLPHPHEPAVADAETPSATPPAPEDAPAQPADPPQDPPAVAEE